MRINRKQLKHSLTTSLNNELNKNSSDDKVMDSIFEDNDTMCLTSNKESLLLLNCKKVPYYSKQWVGSFVQKQFINKLNIWVHYLLSNFSLSIVKEQLETAMSLLWCDKVPYEDPEQLIFTIEDNDIGFDEFCGASESKAIQDLSASDRKNYKLAKKLEKDKSKQYVDIKRHIALNIKDCIHIDLKILYKHKLTWDNCVSVFDLGNKYYVVQGKKVLAKDKDSICQVIYNIPCIMKKLNYKKKKIDSVILNNINYLYRHARTFIFKSSKVKDYTSLCNYMYDSDFINKPKWTSIDELNGLDYGCDKFSSKLTNLSYKFFGADILEIFPDWDMYGTYSLETYNTDGLTNAELPGPNEKLSTREKKGIKKIYNTVRQEISFLNNHYYANQCFNLYTHTPLTSAFMLSLIKPFKEYILKSWLSNGSLEDINRD